MRIYKNAPKFIAVLLSGCLLCTSGLAEAAVALAQPVPVSLITRLTPPPALGEIVDSYTAANWLTSSLADSNKPIGSSANPPISQSANQPPLVILIQDLHAHYGAQKNIAGLLEFLSQKLGATSHEPRATSKVPFAVAVEGASGPIDSSVMALFPDKKIKEAAAEYLMREGELTGAEYFAVMRGIPDALVGVEDGTYYALHRELFRKTWQDRQRLVGLLKGLQADIATLKRKVYSRGLRTFQRKLNAFHNGEMGANAAIAWLSREAAAFGMDASALQRRGDRFFEDLEALAFILKIQKAKTPMEKDLIQVEHDLALLLKVADLQATEQDVRTFGPRLNQFAALGHSLLTSNGLKGFDEAKVRELISTSIDYYAMAMMRNQPMADNTLALIGQRDLKPQTSNLKNNKAGALRFEVTGLRSEVRDQPAVAVLVAGGFHTAPITQILKEKKISYIVLTPTIEHFTEADHELYVERLNGKPLTTKEVIAAADKMDAAPAAPSRLASLWPFHSTDKSLSIGFGLAPESFIKFSVRRLVKRNWTEQQVRAVLNYVPQYRRTQVNLWMEDVFQNSRAAGGPATAPRLSEITHLRPYSATGSSTLFRGEWKGQPWFIKVDRTGLAERGQQLYQEIRGIPNLRNYLFDETLINVVSADEDRLLRVAGSPDKGSLKGEFYLMTPAYAGMMLSDHQSKLTAAPPTSGSAQETEILNVLEAVAHAVGDFHHHEIAHRDLRPSQIFIVLDQGRASAVKINDFDLSTAPGYPTDSLPPGTGVLSLDHGVVRLEDDKGRDVFALIKIAVGYGAAIENSSVGRRLLALAALLKTDSPEDSLTMPTIEAVRVYLESLRPLVGQLASPEEHLEITEAVRRLKEDTPTAPTGSSRGPGRGPKGVLPVVLMALFGVTGITSAQTPREPTEQTSTPPAPQAPRPATPRAPNQPPQMPAAEIAGARAHIQQMDADTLRRELRLPLASSIFAVPFSNFDTLQIFLERFVELARQDETLVGEMSTFNLSKLLRVNDILAIQKRAGRPDGPNGQEIADRLKGTVLLRVSEAGFLMVPGDLPQVVRNLSTNTASVSPLVSLSGQDSGLLLQAVETGYRKLRSQRTMFSEDSAEYKSLSVLMGHPLSGIASVRSPAALPFLFGMLQETHGDKLPHATWSDALQNVLVGLSGEERGKAFAQTLRELLTAFSKADAQTLPYLRTMLTDLISIERGTSMTYVAEADREIIRNVVRRLVKTLLEEIDGRPRSATGPQEASNPRAAAEAITLMLKPAEWSLTDLDEDEFLTRLNDTDKRPRLILAMKILNEFFPDPAKLVRTVEDLAAKEKNPDLLDALARELKPLVQISVRIEKRIIRSYEAEPPAPPPAPAVTAPAPAVSPDSGNAPPGGLIGKYFFVTEPLFDPEANVIRFRGRHIDTGAEEDIELPATRMSDKALSRFYIQLPQNTGHPIFDAVSAWFLAGQDFKGDVLILGPNKYGIHGMGTRRVVALGEKYRLSSVAIFHEVAEAMGAQGKLNVDTVVNRLIDRSGFDREMQDPRHQALPLHYALRALQQEARPSEDRTLELQIQGRLSNEEVFKIAQKSGVRRFAAVMREFFLLRDQGLMSSKEQDEAALQRLIAAERETERQERLLREQEELRRQQRETEEMSAKREIEEIVDQAMRRDAERPGSFLPLQNELSRRLLAWDETWVADVLGRLLIEHADVFWWDMEGLQRRGFLISVARRQRVAGQSKIVAVLYQEARLQGLSASKANLLNLIAQLVHQNTVPSLTYSRDMEAGIMADIMRWLRGRPGIEIKLVEAIPRYEDYFDLDPENNDRLYFKDDFLKEIEDIRDLDARKRLVDLYQKATFHRHHTARTVAALLTKDAGPLFDALLRQLETGSTPLGLEGQIELASLLSASFRNDLRNAPGLHKRLVEVGLRLQGLPTTRAQQERMSDSLYTLGSAQGDPEGSKMLFRHMKRRLEFLAGEIQKSGPELAKAKNAYQEAKKNPTASPESLLEQLSQATIQAWKKNEHLMQEMEQSLGTLRQLAQTALDPRAAQQDFAQEILTHLMHVARQAGWDEGIRAEAITALSPFIEANHPDVIAFFIDELYPRPADPLRKNYETLFHEAVPDRRILEFVHLFPNAGLNGERAIYLLLRRYKDRPDLLKSLIQEGGVDIRFRLYAFHLYSSKYLKSETVNENGRSVATYDEEELARLLPFLQEDTEAFVRETLRQPSGTFWKLFNDPLLQDEEAKVYATATLISVRRKLPIVHAKGYAEIAGLVSGTVVRKYWNNASNKFTLGGALFARVEEPTSFFFQVLAHELMHDILFFEAEYASDALNRGIIHEMVADLHAMAFSEIFDLRTAPMQRALRYVHYWEQRENHGFNAIEAHEGGRVQLQVLLNYFETTGRSMDIFKLITVAMKVVKRREFDFKNAAELTEIILRAYVDQDIEDRIPGLYEQTLNRSREISQLNRFELPDDEALQQPLLSLGGLAALFQGGGLAPLSSAAPASIVHGLLRLAQLLGLPISDSAIQKWGMRFAYVEMAALPVLAWFVAAATFAQGVALFAVAHLLLQGLNRLMRGPPVSLNSILGQQVLLLSYSLLAVPGVFWYALLPIALIHFFFDRRQIYGTSPRKNIRAPIKNKITQSNADLDLKGGMNAFIPPIPSKDVRALTYTSAEGLAYAPAALPIFLGIPDLAFGRGFPTFMDMGLLFMGTILAVIWDFPRLLAFIGKRPTGPPLPLGKATSKSFQVLVDRFEEALRGTSGPRNFEIAKDTLMEMEGRFPGLSERDSSILEQKREQLQRALAARPSVDELFGDFNTALQEKDLERAKKALIDIELRNVSDWTRPFLQRAQGRYDQVVAALHTLQEGLPRGTEIMFFGSTARGEARPGSDVDYRFMVPRDAAEIPRRQHLDRLISWTDHLNQFLRTRGLIPSDQRPGYMTVEGAVQERGAGRAFNQDRYVWVVSADSVRRVDLNKFQPRVTWTVGQGEFIVTSGGSRYPVVTTLGAANCVILTIQDPISHVGVLAHIDASNLDPGLQDPLGELLEAFTKKGGNLGRARYLIRGDQDAANSVGGETQKALSEALQARGISAAIATDYRSMPDGSSRNGGLDTRTDAPFDFPLNRADDSSKRASVQAYQRRLEHHRLTRRFRALLQQVEPGEAKPRSPIEFLKLTGLLNHFKFGQAAKFEIGVLFNMARSFFFRQDPEAEERERGELENEHNLILAAEGKPPVKLKLLQGSWLSMLRNAGEAESKTRTLRYNRFAPSGMKLYILVHEGVHMERTDWDESQVTRRTDEIMKAYRRRLNNLPQSVSFAARAIAAVRPGPTVNRFRSVLPHLMAGLHVEPKKALSMTGLVDKTRQGLLGARAFSASA